MSTIRIGRIDQAARLIMVAAVMYGLAAVGIELTRSGERIASLWLANGAVLAVILLAARREWPQLAAAAFVANVSANLVAGDTLPSASFLAGCNLVEIMLVARLLGDQGRESIDGPAGVLRFTSCATAGALLSGSLATLFVSPTLDWAALGLFSQWVMADLLGLLMVAPLALAWLQRPADRGVARSPLESFAFIIFTAALTVAIFALPYPHMFLLAPVMLAAGFRLSVRSASLVAATAAIIAAAATFSGSGPIANSAATPEQMVLLLQAFFAVSLFLTLPVSAMAAQRFRLDRALKASERQFRLMTEASPAGILHCDLDGTPLYLNARWTELTGIGLDQIRSQGWESVIPAADRSRATALWHQVRGRIEQGSDCLPCSIIGCQSGWAEIVITPERDTGGQLVGWVVRLSDVSESNHVGHTLRKSEALYRLLADNVRDIIMRLDLDGSNLFVSAAAKPMLGIEPEQMVGKSVGEFVHPSDWADVQRSLERAVTGDCEQAVRYRKRCADGRYLWVEAAYRLVRDPTSGVPVEIIATVRDIDRRYKAETVAAEAARKLRENVRLLNMAEELALVGHWNYDGATGDFDASTQATEIAGCGRSVVLTRSSALAMIASDDRKAVRTTVLTALRDRTVAVCQARLIRADGEERFVHIAAQSQPGPDGAPTGVFGVVHDITAKVADQRALIKAVDESRAAAEAKSMFLATMSHEIRTPMTGVLGMIDLLLDNPTKAQRLSFLATLKQSAHLLMAVLDDVLDFSKIEHGQMKIHHSDFDFEAMAQSTIDLFFNAASSKGLLISLAVDSGASPFVHGDPVRIQQVMSNLINNAIKFTQQGSVLVKAKASPAGDDGRQLWRVEVRDTGIGISAEQIGCLFEPFTQANPADGARFAGVGLGLSISRRLIDAMGGTMGVESIEGAGSTFWFEITLGQSISQIERVRPSLAAGHSVRPLDVLVAEDNPVNQLLVTALLRRQGHVPLCVDNGRKAVEAATARAYDCILMDMQMPEMDGITATRTIRQSGGPCANAPIIALTADASAERRRFYDNAGLTDFMTKPIDAEALAARLAKIAAAPVVEPMAAPIDADHFDRLRAALGPKRLHGLVDLFLTEIDQRPTTICDHLLAGRLDQARHEAHSLKGSALSIGATPLGELAHKIEQLPSAADIKVNARLMGELEGEVDRLRLALSARPPVVAAGRGAS